MYLSSFVYVLCIWQYEYEYWVCMYMYIIVQCISSIFNLRSFILLHSVHIFCRLRWFSMCTSRIARALKMFIAADFVRSNRDRPPILSGTRCTVQYIIVYLLFPSSPLATCVPFPRFVPVRASAHALALQSCPLLRALVELVLDHSESVSASVRCLSACL